MPIPKANMGRDASNLNFRKSEKKAFEDMEKPSSLQRGSRDD